MSEEISFDFKKIKKNYYWLIPLVSILFIMFIAVFLRTMPLRMPITDDWASSTIENSLKSQISQQISLQYPNLPLENQQSLVNKEFQKQLLENKDIINQQTAQLSSNYKDQYRDAEGNLYLLGIDPYHFYRQTHYVLENGYPGTTIKDGQVIDEYRLAPKGARGASEFHITFSAYWHKFLNIFGEVPLIVSFFWVGVIFSALAVIPAYFIGKKFTGNNVGAFFTGLLMAVAAFFVSRTTGESSDTDIYVVFFPLLIAWLFFEAFSAKTLRNKLTWASLAGLATGIFSYAWTGWWYIFDIILATLGVYIIYSLIVNRSKIKEYLKSLTFLNNIYTALTYFLSSLFFVGLITGVDKIFQFLKGPLSFLALKDVSVTSLWPNIFTTVAELNAVSLTNVISQLGGRFLFFLALIGIVLIFMKKDKEGNYDIKAATFLIIWFLISLWATTKGVRFILQATPVFALSLGTFMGLTWEKVSKWSSKEMNIEKWVSQLVIFFILCLIMIQPISAGYSAAYQSVPSMNDGWYNTLDKIKQEAPQDIIMTSWWDFGYWFRAVADRPVTFDGGTQVGYGAYWVGKSFLVEDEKQTMGILRMLNCGQDYAFEEVNKVLDNTAESVELLNKIIVVDEKEARDILTQNGLDDSVLQYTHCDAPVDYYITSDDMVGKAGVWGHFGSWNFTKAMMYQETRNLGRAEAVNHLVNNYDLTESEADQLHYEITKTAADQWVADWPSYVSGLTSCTLKSSVYECNVNSAMGGFVLKVDLENETAKIGDQKIDSLVYPTKEEVKKVELGGDIPISAIMVPNDGSYKVIMAQPAHAYSIFTKLFFFDGHGLTCFEKFDDASTFTGGQIKTWVVDYQCGGKIDMLTKEEVKAAHILIGFDGRTEEEALELIESLEVTADNFASMVKEYSDCPSSVEGGSLGWFGKGQMVPEFEKAAFSLKVGEISEPVKTSFGYHLIYVEDKRGE
jgi:dolichyl-phosphooligosaccharide-protein glycotransferase